MNTLTIFTFQNLQNFLLVLVGLFVCYCLFSLYRKLHKHTTPQEMSDSERLELEEDDLAFMSTPELCWLLNYAEKKSIRLYESYPYDESWIPWFDLKIQVCHVLNARRTKAPSSQE